MLANNALLVTLSVSVWTARKQDKQATREVAINHGVAAGVGTYNKSVLPGAAELDHIKKCTGAARTFFYKNTLPWSTQGAAVLPNKNYLWFTQEMRALKQEWEQAVQAFLQVYPTLKANAKAQLNGLYNEADYPADPAKLFKFEINFLPVPQEGDFRIELAKEEMEAFKANVLNSEREANADLWKRLYEVAHHAAERLRDPDAVFRDTLVENAVELCSMLPRLNFNDDPDLEAMRVAVEKALCDKAPEALRQLPSVRKATVNDLDAILEKMSGYIG